MVNHEIRNRLLKELGGISRQALSQRAKLLKNKYGPMSTEEAIYVLAHLEGIDLSKHLPLATIDRIRSLVPRELSPATKSRAKPAGKTGRRKPQPPLYPLVKSPLIKTAVELGTEVFPKIFVLENSIRNLIKDRLSPLDENWWDKLVPLGVQRRVQIPMGKEKKYPYRKPRSDHPLYYSTFADLKEIILANPEGKFDDLLIKPDWFTAGMDDVYMARNNLAHSIPLEKTDILAIQRFYSEWAILLESMIKK